MFYMASPDNLCLPIVECLGKDDLHDFSILNKKVSSNENVRLCVRKKKSPKKQKQTEQKLIFRLIIREA